MKASSASGLLAVRTEGGLISPDILARLVSPRPDLEGVSADAYHLGTERFGEAITRSWNRMRGEWTRLQEGVARLPPTDPATGLTRDRFLYPLFQELGYGRLVPARGLEVGGRTSSVSHAGSGEPAKGSPNSAGAR